MCWISDKPDKTLSLLLFLTNLVSRVLSYLPSPSSRGTIRRELWNEVGFNVEETIRWHNECMYAIWAIPSKHKWLEHKPNAK